jgi:hypothetical protein
VWSPATSSRTCLPPERRPLVRPPRADGRTRSPAGELQNYGRARSARLVHDYYEEIKGKGFFARHAELLDGTDRLDSALLSEKDVLDPQRVILLGFTLDSRSGLGGFRDYYLYLGMALRSMTLDEVLESEQVKERVAKMRADDAAFVRRWFANSKAMGNVVITDFRHVDVIPTGNRFLIHTLFPECTISVRLQWGPQRKVVMATAGHNIFDRSSWSNIGQTMGLFGGGRTSGRRVGAAARGRRGREAARADQGAPGPGIGPSRRRSG